MNTVLYRVLLCIIVIFHGIDPQQYVLHAEKLHPCRNPAANDTRISSRSGWRPACTPSNEHLLSTARHDGWCLVLRRCGVAPIPQSHWQWLGIFHERDRIIDNHIDVQKTLWIFYHSIPMTYPFMKVINMYRSSRDHWWIFPQILIATIFHHGRRRYFRLCKSQDLW